MFGTQTYTRGIDFLLSKKNVFNYHSLLPLQCLKKKNIPFWIVKTRDCLVLKLTREVSISSSAKMLLTTIILSLLYNIFKKNLPFLDRQNSGLFGTQTYARGIDFFLSKKATTLICRYGVYGQGLVFNRIERWRKYKTKKKKTILHTNELRRR